MALNYYRLLGIPTDADQTQIKTAYRNLAKRCHPDTNRGSEAAAELFRQINDAYRILADDKTRSEYDKKLGLKTPQPAPKSAVPPSSEQKFKNFLNSLLDAIFVPSEPIIPPAERPVPPPRSPASKPRKPDFRFYFHLALEKEGTSYECGSDGKYRKPAK